jgi:hypothetical protein
LSNVSDATSADDEEVDAIGDDEHGGDEKGASAE